MHYARSLIMQVQQVKAASQVITGINQLMPIVKYMYI